MDDNKKAVAAMTDRMGNVIWRGDYVVYSNSLGRSSRPAIGLVRDIYEMNGRYLTNRDEVFNVIKITSLQDRSSYRGRYAKDVTITQADRVLAYPKPFVDGDTRELLEAGEIKKGKTRDKVVG